MQKNDQDESDASSASNHSHSTTYRDWRDFEAFSSVELKLERGILRDEINWAVQDGDRERAQYHSNMIRAVEAELARRSETKNLGDEQGGKRESQADVLVKLVEQSGAELFHTSIAEPFISFSIRNHIETWPVRSKATRRWMTEQFYRTTGKAPNAEGMQAALGVVEAIATFSDKQQHVHLRTAWHDGALYYDLADNAWRAVRIDREGWEIVSKPPVCFRRYSHTAAQVDPARSDNLESIWSFLNISEPRDRRLVEAWLVAALIPDIPRPILVAHGDQGSAKSTVCKMLLSLVDPSATPCLRTRDGTELVQALAHRFAAVFDNVSYLPDWLSDLLCCAVTGDGFSKPMLYSDDDDVIYSYRRALLFNGINVAISKPDLLDRSLLIQLERLADAGRRDEAMLWKQFDVERPRIVGGLFTLLSHAIREYDNLKLARLPRMADFAKWAIAASGDGEQFLLDYDANVELQTEQAVAESLTATVLLEYLDDKPAWSGQPYELHAALKERANAMKISEKQFPATPAALGKKLREVRPSLQPRGWNVEFSKSGPRRISITRIMGKSAVHAVHAVQNADKNADGTDGTDGTDGKIPHFSGRTTGWGPCRHCGGKVIERTWHDGRRDLGCHGCGRGVKQ